MGKAWFAPKRVGYGGGLPISWEGWAVLVGFLIGMWALLYFSPLLLPPMEATLVRLAGLAILIAGFVAIARAKTEGGWRWRNGTG
jgi:hypothetical protein